MTKAKARNVLVCPLDWGLGHATRSIPIIKYLVEQNYNVIIAADNEPLALLRQEFPELDWVKLPGCKIVYTSGSFMAGAILKTLPSFLRNNKKEHKLLKKIIEEKNIDAVISDNRYGLWNNNIPTVLITHQLKVISFSGFHWADPIIHRYINKAMNKFSFCWVPDVGGPLNLSGKLSHFNPFPAKARYIGPISRFKHFLEDNEIVKNEPYKLMGIASGPEPQRTIFENILTRQFLKDGGKSIILRGLPANKGDEYVKDNITYVNHLPTDLMAHNILKSEIVFCRAGYSTIMDLALLKKNKNVVLIPTPGQTEQEYLASRMKSSGYFYSMSQDRFSLKRIREELAAYKCIDFPEGHDLFERAMHDFLKLVR